MKVLMLQLPVPNNRLSNLPLALGYLKASALAAGIPGLKVEILDRPIQDRGGDAYLLDAILARSPDLVGFSLYTWNSSRALDLAASLKKAAPEILILAGGPEVNRDGTFILDRPEALDFLVLGEGERTFVELLKALNRPGEKTGAFSLIPGLVFHPPGTREWHFNLPRLAIEDVNLIPSAYLSGALEGHLERFMMVELSRWCPSKCTFCYYGKQDLPRGGKRYFDTGRLRQELLFGLEHGVEQIHFVEANFNTLPHLPEIYQTIQETGAGRQIRFYAEMRGEAITEAEAKRLASCNFSIVECGLQSAVPEVLARVKRKNHLPRLVQGVHFLREQGIEVFLDAILGLPGDTPATFNRTLDFIEENGLAPYDLFHLQILPGTQLKAEGLQGEHGLEWQSAPPYFALQTSELTFEKLCELRRQTLLRKGEDPSEIQGLPSPGLFSLAEPESSHLFTGTGLPIERLIIEKESLFDPEALAGLSRKLASEVTLWLKPGKLEGADLEACARALNILSLPNPSGVWHIFIEAGRPLTPEERRKLIAAIKHEAGYLDRLAIFALEEKDPARFKIWPSIKLLEVVPWQNQFIGKESPETIWRLELPAAESLEQWTGRLKALEPLMGYGINLVFPGKVSMAKGRALLENFSNEKILFVSNQDFAAGLISSQSDGPTSFNYPLTLGPGKVSTLNQPAPQELERAALAWTLAGRAAPVHP